MCIRLWHKAPPTNERYYAENNVVIQNLGSPLLWHRALLFLSVAYLRLYSSNRVLDMVQCPRLPHWPHQHGVCEVVIGELLQLRVKL
jgi:hypothetical protein